MPYKDREKYLQKLKLQYHNRIEAGFCGACGKNPTVPNKVLCSACEEKQKARSPVYKKKKYVALVSNNICPRCQKNPADIGKKYCSQCLQYTSDWSKSHIRSRNMASKKFRDKIKKEVFLHYGMKCACCGEDTYEFLAIDHINGGGNEHRKKLFGRWSAGYQFYCWLKKNNYPKGFQTLCYNCNQAKSVYGICPHQKK